MSARGEEGDLPQVIPPTFLHSPGSKQVHSHSLPNLSHPHSFIFTEFAAESYLHWASMQGEAGASCRHRKQGMVPLLAEETEENSMALQPILSSQSLASSSSPSSPSSSGLSTPSSSSSSSASSSLSSPLSFPPRSQRRSTAADQRRRSKPTRERHPQHLPKPFSEPAIPSMQETLAMDAAEKSSVGLHAMYRRCVTDTDFKTIHGVTSQAAPDLLQLFNIFQFNTPQTPPARMLVNVTLVGNIQSVRLLVANDASVQDVIKASLKGYVKEGRLPRHCIKSQTYGLHYSPFCLESIDPTEMICSLGTRSFFLFPRVDQLSNPTQNSKEEKPWWNILSLLHKA